MENRFPPRHNVPGEPILRVEGLTSPNPRSFRDVSFELRRGEILGVGGLVGAQRTELLEALFGLRAISGGKILLNGKQVHIDSPQQAMADGMALLTEERRKSGIFPMLSVLENTVVANLRRYVKRPFYNLDEAQCEADAMKNIETLRIKTPTFHTPPCRRMCGNTALAIKNAER